jgi:ketosteroid isomerase-like protein
MGGVMAPRSNTDLAREFWSLWRHDGLAELLSRYDEFFTEDLVWRSPIAEMRGVTYVGRAGLELHLADLTEAFDEIRATPVEIVEIAPQVVRSRMRILGKGSASGVTVDSPFLGIARLRDARICWAWGSFDVDEGERLAAAIARGEEAEI